MEAIQSAGPVDGEGGIVGGCDGGRGGEVWRRRCTDWRCPDYRAWSVVIWEVVLSKPLKKKLFIIVLLLAT